MKLRKNNRVTIDINKYIEDYSKPINVFVNPHLGGLESGRKYNILNPNSTYNKIIDSIKNGIMGTVESVNNRMHPPYVNIRLDNGLVFGVNSMFVIKLDKFK
jgi:hypothetical protein